VQGVAVVSWAICSRQLKPSATISQSGGRLADGGEKFEFADGFRDVVFVFFEAEGASHAAASGSGAVEVDADAAQDGFFGGHLHDGFVMAVAVDEALRFELGQREFLRVLLPGIR
jgi:hypothetical protein